MRSLGIQLNVENSEVVGQLRVYRFHNIVIVPSVKLGSRFQATLFVLFKDVFAVNSGVVKVLDLTGVEQLTDAFFVMIQFLHQDSSFCNNLDSLSLAGCTHVTDLSVVYITSLFPNLKQVIL